MINFKYADMSAARYISELETVLNHTFINIDGDVESIRLDYKIDETLENFNKGFSSRLPYYKMPLVNSENSRSATRELTLVGGLSNVGKSTFARSSTLRAL